MSELPDYWDTEMKRVEGAVDRQEVIKAFPPEKQLQQRRGKAVGRMRFRCTLGGREGAAAKIGGSWIARVGEGL